MNEVLDQPKLREDLVHALRQMAERGANVRELVEKIQRTLGYGPDVLIPVLWYLMKTFDLTLLQVLPIREWLGTKPGDGYDEEIDALILPLIRAQNPRWKPSRSAESLVDLGAKK